MAIEWKGEDRITNEDTKYKEELGRLWQKLPKKMEGMAKQFQGHNGEIDPNNLDMSKINMNQFANMKGMKKKKLRIR